jgi:transducin (beta)-like 1
MLVTLLQRGLHYTSIEFHLSDDGTERECSKPYSLLDPHVCEKKAIHGSPAPRPTTPASRLIGFPLVRKEREKEKEKEHQHQHHHNHHHHNQQQQQRQEYREGGEEEEKELFGQRPKDKNKEKEKEKDGNSKKRRKESTSSTMGEATNTNGNGKASKRAAKEKKDLGVIGASSTSGSFEKVKILTGHESEVITCGWNPSRAISLLASASGDGTVRLWTVPGEGNWDVEDAKLSVRVLEHTPSSTSSLSSGESRDVTTLDWSPDGQVLATGCYDGKARLWSVDGELLAVLSQHTGPVFQLQWSADGAHLVSVGLDPSVAVWDVAGRTLRRAFRDHTAPALDVDWRDNRTFATCSTDKQIHIYSLDRDGSGPILTLSGHTDEVNSIKWSPSGNMLVSSSDDMTARVWRVAADLSHAEQIFCLAEHTMEIYTAKWCKTSPETGANLWIATASFDGTVKIWDSQTGTCHHTLSHHTQPVYAIAFSPCGRFLASGSLDAVICLWSVSEGKLLRTYQGHGGTFEVAWSPSGHRIAACTSNATLCVLDVRPE